MTRNCSARTAMVVNTDQKDTVLAVVPVLCQWIPEANLPTSEYSCSDFLLFYTYKMVRELIRDDSFFSKLLRWCNKFSIHMHTHTANFSTKTFHPSEDPILMRWRSFCFCKGVLCVCGCNVVASLFCPTFVTEIKDKHYILEVFLVLATNIAFPCRFLKLLTRVLAHAQHHEQNENRLIWIGFHKKRQKVKRKMN